MQNLIPPTSSSALSLVVWCCHHEQHAVSENFHSSSGLQGVDVAVFRWLENKASCIASINKSLLLFDPLYYILPFQSGHLITLPFSTPIPSHFPSHFLPFSLCLLSLSHSHTWYRGVHYPVCPAGDGSTSPKLWISLQAYIQCKWWIFVAMICTKVFLPCLTLLGFIYLCFLSTACASISRLLPVLLLHLADMDA